jgi:hypothetical protein
VDGRRYLGDAIVSLSKLDPLLDPVILVDGEAASGWIVFDVPARHGELVPRGILDERHLGIWKC